MVRKVSILCMVASLLFSLEAATPLVTQYIAPADDPRWEAAVTNAPYGTGKGFEFKVCKETWDGNIWHNFYITLKGLGHDHPYFVAMPNWLRFRVNDAPLILADTYSWTRSVVSPAGAPGRRYLYHAKFNDAGGFVGANHKTITIAGAEAQLDWDKRFTKYGGDSSPADAVYVQCVHTDWVYTVTFDANGGSGTMGDFVFTNSAALPANAFSRTGYDFSKWDTSPSGSGQYNDCATVAHDLKLYAIWSACQYTLTFDSCGGSDVSGSETVTYDSTYATLPVPTRSGYKFDGWYTEANGGKKVARGDKVSIAGDHTLYAHWVASSIKVTLNLNAGGDSSASIDGDAGEKTVNYDSEYGALPSATRSGYEFLGWWTSTSGGVKVTADTIVSFSSNHTLYAHWGPAEIKFIFEKNGGSGGTDEIQVSYGQTVPMISVPSLRGYEFLGYWFTNSNNVGVQYYAANGEGLRTWDVIVPEAEGEVQLWAKWGALEYTIAFQNNGATDGPETVKLTYGAKPKGLSKVPRYNEGYIFKGYFTEDDGGGKKYWDSLGKWVGGDIWTDIEIDTVYAFVKSKSLLVSFDPNGGECDIDNIEVVYGDLYGELPVPSCPKHLFVGWYTAQGGGTLTTADSEVEKTENHTLYAHWQDNTVNVRFDAGEGFIGNVSVTNVIGVYEKGTNCGSLPIPTNSVSSRSFAGWWTSTNPVDRVQILSTNIVDVAMTNLYARWKEVVSEEPCTLTFILADKTSTNVTAIVGDEFGRWFLDPAPQYTGGYRHFGWYRADSRVEETDIIEGDETLTGRWTLGAFTNAWNCSSVQFETDGDNVSGWTMDETNKVARSGDVTGLAEEYASSRLTMKPAVAGTLSLKLKTSCLPKHPDFSWLACLYINSTYDCIGGPESCRDVSIHLDGGATFYLNYYQYGGAHSYYDSVDYTVEDCAWASDFSFVPDAAECPLPEWTALADKTLSAKTGGSAQWVVVADDGDSLVITNLPNARSGWVALETSKNRAGVLEFKWRTSCEGGYVDTNGVYQVCDRLEFQDERGERTLLIEGVMSDWESVVWTNSVESAHTFTWRYVKDGDTSAGDDAAWIKDVKWTPFPPEPKPFRVLIW